MESLSDDLLPELMRALGNSTYSYASGVRVSAVNRALREVGARLPTVNGESVRCTLTSFAPIF